ncbi:MAG: oligosaccharide flippase family protein [Candidatus Hydrogenedentes bacterium]|nr:oligosaccharide flippase family protein [Candidatus Hydrogenedentota bacterium]
MSAHPYSAAALRRGAWHFLSGKAVSGLLTFVILLWLVRLLPVAEYGAYVSLVAAAELAFALGGLGLPWAAARFLPEVRLHARPDLTRALAWRLACWQAAVLGALAVLAGLTFDRLLPRLGLAVPAGAALAWAALLFAEGTGRFLREGLLGPLLCQDTVRLSLVARQILFILCIAGLAASGEASLSTVLAVELMASLLAAVVALAGLARHLRRLPAQDTGWQAPPARAVWRVALPMYGGHLLTLAYGPQVFLLLLARFAGAEAAAVFGFLRSLYEQAARYLPATLLFSLVRPKLVASYVGGGGMAELTRNANLAGKLSLFVLMPVVAFAFAGGETLIKLLSGGKFPQTGLLFFGFMLALIPFSQRQLLETVAVTTGRAGLCTLGAAMGLLTLPLMLWLLSMDSGPWAGVAGLGVGHLLFALTAVLGLKSTGYHADLPSLARLALAALAGALAAMLVPSLSNPWLELGGLALASGSAFLSAAWLLGPFASNERQRMNRLLGREVFPA